MDKAGRSPAGVIERHAPNDIEWQGLPNMPSISDDSDDPQKGTNLGHHDESIAAFTRAKHSNDKKIELSRRTNTGEADARSPKLPRLERQQRADASISEPGAYRVRDGSDPRRATSFVSHMSSTQGPTRPSVLASSRTEARQSSSNDAATIMVEASLVAEDADEGEEEKRDADIEPTEPRNVSSLLVEATPVRPTKPIVLALALLAVVAAAVGLAVGLTRDTAKPATSTASSGPAGTAPSLSPAALRSSVPSSAPTTTSLSSLLLSNLPPHTTTSMEDPTSPQARAFAWITDHLNDLDVNPQVDGQDVWLARVTQRFALATLYYATGGESSWNGTSRWLDANAHECTWYGCCCGPGCTVGTGALTSISLDRNGLGGQLPREIGLLTGLDSLELGYNVLSGSTPTDLGALTSLSLLYLLGNRLSSTIPTELGRLTRLRDLQLSMNGYTGPIPSQLGELSMLSTLTLWENQLTSTIPTQLGRLANVTLLSVHTNNVTGPIPTEIGELSDLKSLYLYDCQLNSTIPTELGRLSNVRDVRLSTNRLTGPIPTELGLLSVLQILYMEANFLTSRVPDAFGDMSALSDVTLANNRLSGPIPTHFGRLTSLTSFWLNQNQLSSVLPTELGLLSNLSPEFPIRLGFNNLTGTVPSELCQLRYVNSLRLLVDCDKVTCDCDCSCAELANDDYWYP